MFPKQLDKFIGEKIPTTDIKISLFQPQILEDWEISLYIYPSNLFLGNPFKWSPLKRDYLAAWTFE